METYIVLFNLFVGTFLVGAFAAWYANRPNKPGN